jgi:polysaccharide export outer membrane protein
MTAMKTLLRLLTAALVVPALQACSTPGGVPEAGDALSSDSAAEPKLSPAAGADADYVPAVVGIPTDPGPAVTYRIGPHDLLRIEVFQVEELSSQERVNEEGLIVMPLIGNVRVGGLTPQEAERAIADRLGENYLQNPQVNVFVMEYASQKVTVTGHVKSPGVFPLAGETTLMQAIALAGGLDEVAKKQEIVVFRRQKSGAVNAYVVDLAAIEQGKLTDPRMVADDRVVVPKSGMAVVGRSVNNVLTGWALRVPFL